jgi:HlyD family secretion protein
MFISLSRRCRLVVLGAGLALLLACTIKCSFSPAAVNLSCTDATPGAVDTTRLANGTATQIVEQSGQIEAEKMIALYARVAGYVKARHVDIGDEVKKGQLLAEVSVPELDEELRQKEATVELAQACVVVAERGRDAAKANVERAEAAVSQAEAVHARAQGALRRWSSERERAQKLQHGDAIAASEVDCIREQFQKATTVVAETTAARRMARADHKARLAELAGAQASVSAAQAKHRSARADRDRTAQMVAFARITAPFDGVVTFRGIEVGQLVGPLPGSTPLFNVVHTRRMRVLVDVPESAAASVCKGMKAEVRVGVLGEYALVGEVTRTSWALDSRTRTMRTQVELDNHDGLLRPGMSATVRLTLKLVR